MALRTDYKDAELAESMTGRKQYKMINNNNGTVSFVDVTEYTQNGDFLHASALNEANESINELVSRKTENLTVTFEQATAPSELNSGDKLSVLFSKISKLVSDAIVHLRDTLIHVPAISELTNDAVLKNDGKGLLWYKLPNIDVEFVYGLKADFPSTGAAKTVYVDTTRSQYFLYMWNGTGYCPIGGGDGGVSMEYIMNANKPFVISLKPDDFVLNKTTGRYEAIVESEYVNSDTWLEWHIVRNGDYLTSEESKITSGFTDIVSMDRKIKFISTTLPEKAFSLNMKIIL